MFGADESPGAWMAAIAAGGAAAFSIFAFYLFVYQTSQENAYKKRMDLVKDRRGALRDAQLGVTRQAKTAAEIRRMEAALSFLKLNAQLSDQVLKLRLTRAGKRSRSDLVRFVFMQIALPPVFAALAYVAYQFMAKPEAFNLTTTLCVVLVGAMLGYILPGMQLDGLAKKRKERLLLAYPDALDLLTICVEAGMSVEQSFNRVADELGADAAEMAEEMQLTTAELSYLGDRRQALENFADRTDLLQVKAITSALAQAERYGTPVGQALRVLSAESRFERMARAETKAAALPAKLTVPMMVFFVPVLFIVILTPAVLQVMDLG